MVRFIHSRFFSTLFCVRCILIIAYYYYHLLLLLYYFGFGFFERESEIERQSKASEESSKNLVGWAGMSKNIIIFCLLTTTGCLIK
jgi:hypothetical protein